MVREVRPELVGHGAGTYGVERGFTGHRCGRCANPFTGGNPDCPNNRPSQWVPYEELRDDDS